MSADFLEDGWSEDPEGLIELDRARAMCGVHVGEECLPPDLEEEAALLFHTLACWLEAHASAQKLKRNAA